MLQAGKKYEICKGTLASAGMPTANHHANAESLKASQLWLRFFQRKGSSARLRQD